MKLIVFFTFNTSLNDWKKTGVISRELNIYEKLASKGIKITFLTYGTKSDFKINLKKNINIIPIFTVVKKTKFKLVNLILSIISIFILKKKLEKYDIIKTHQIYGSWLALLAKYLYNIPLVLRGGYEPISFEKNFIKFPFVFLTSYISYIFSDIILLSNKLDIKYVKNLIFIDFKKIKYFPNTINLRKFFIKQDIKKRSQNFVFIGRLTKQKNLFYILDLIKKLNDELDIYGSGPLKKELIEYSKQNNIKVNFHANIDNNKLIDVYNKFKFCVLLSQYEGSPKVMLEAMACGCIMITSKVKGIIDIITHKKNGFYYYSDIQNLKKLMKNINLQKKISLNSHNVVKKKYNHINFIEKEYRIYKKLCMTT